jgi:4-hydroxy-3-methylbut-2-enyl diphosphate reductase
VIFSAHGVPKSVPEAAAARNLFYVDATCPLVSKVHIGAQRQHSAGNEIVLIGHSGHPEVIGTMGQLPAGAAVLVETLADAERFEPRDPARLAYVTQTTLSVDDTREIVDCLKRRFPSIRGPHGQDICYATTNRQEAVKRVAPRADAVLVIGAPNSSNSRRLVEVAERHGCARALLVQEAGDIDWAALAGARTVAVTAGASAPENLVAEVVDAFAARFQVSVETVRTAEESLVFKLPRELAGVSA